MRWRSPGLRGPFVMMVVVSAGLALAAPSSTRKRLQNRSEADEAVLQIAMGRGVDAALTRLKYLGEEAYAFDQLAGYARSADDRQRRDVAMALATLASPGRDRIFLSLLRDDDAAVRMYAVRGLGAARSRNARAVEPMLADKTLGVRREAARVLGGMRQPATGKALMRAAQAEGEPEVRAELLHAVGASGDKRQVKPLVAQLSASSESTRLAAARALCLLSAPQGLGFARKLLGSSDRYERRQAVRLFEGASAKTSRKFLRPLLSDGDRVLAASAARVLHQGGEPKMVDWLVLQAARADADSRAAFERELEALDVSDARRKAILERAGAR